MPVGMEGKPIRGWYFSLCIVAGWTVLALVGPRLYVLRPFASEHTFEALFESLPKALAGGAYDAALMAGIAAVFLAVLIAVRNNAQASRAVYYLFLVFAAILLLAGTLNVRVMSVLHRPLNFQWLVYSDFLQSVDAREAIKASLTIRLMIALFTVIVSYVLIGIYFGRHFSQIEWPFRASEWHVVSLILCSLLIWAVAGHRYAKSHEWSHEEIASPVYAFVHSWLVSSRQPSLFTMKTSISGSEFEPPARSLAPAVFASKSTVKHIIVFVLESTPAEYLGAYNSRYRVTPNLDRWSAHAAVFENVYAHAPATNKSLFSLLCSLYPWISYKSETEESDIPVPSIASYLGQHGYSTGFFSSSDLSFQSAGNFIRSHGFDYSQDYKQRKMARTIFRDERWPFLNGSDDISTAESLTSWFEDHQVAGKQVFAMLWTNMTHYPYFTERVTSDFGPEENRFNLYLNALHYSDRAFGTLMKRLEECKLLDETLVVVVGDHGEAFGQHNQLTHAGNIYEENCHVPLLLINPRLFAAQRRATLGGLIDVAPTIVQILGYQPMKGWQGQSLFDGGRRSRTYFFSPWSDYLFGLREGNRKFIYNASKNSYEAYDLSADPAEEANLVTAGDPKLKEDVGRLAAWVQHQDRLFKRMNIAERK